MLGLRNILLCICLLAPIPPASAADDQSSVFDFGLPEARPPDDTWILVDSRHKNVQIMDNDNPVRIFNHAAFGRGGVGHKHKRGDNVTPKGVYTIGWNNDKSDFRKFFGLTYPSVEDAENGLKHNLINESEYRAILNAHRLHKVPPQNTALGGAVGIHGLGTPLRRWKKHLFFNWTEGCVALTNQQIDELATYVKPGMRVVID